jgi:kynureninase
MPASVPARMLEFTHDWSTRNLNAWWEKWWDLAETEGQEHISKLVNANESESCILVPSVSHVMHQLLSCPELNDPNRRKIITTDKEYPTIYDCILNQNHRFSNLDEETRRKLEFQMQTVESPKEGFDIGGIINAIDEQTALVVIPQVGSFTGDLFNDEDIAKIVAKAEQCGALVMVDGSQAIGSTRINVQTNNVHIYAGTLLKQGSGAMNGYLYIRPDTDLTPSNSGWAGVADPFTHGDPHLHRTPHPSVPRRFYGVGTPQIAPLYHATEGLKIFEQIGYPEIVEDVRAKARYIRQRLIEENLPLASPQDEVHASALLVIHRENATETRDELEKRGVLVTGQEDIIRLAPHIYHSPHEIREATRIIINTLKN